MPSGLPKGMFSSATRAVGADLANRESLTATSLMDQMEAMARSRVDAEREEALRRMAIASSPRVFLDPAQLDDIEWILRKRISPAPMTPPQPNKLLLLLN